LAGKLPNMGLIMLVFRTIGIHPWHFKGIGYIESKMVAAGRSV